MKTQKLFAIAVEAIATISLIALLALVIALTYALLYFLSPDPVTTPVLPSAAIHILAPAKATQSTEVLSTIVELPDYSAMTSRTLRAMARDHKIPKWNKLNKQELIAALSA